MFNGRISLKEYSAKEYGNTNPIKEVGKHEEHHANRIRNVSRLSALYRGYHCK